MTKKDKKSFQEPNGWQKLTTLRSTGFGDVEVLSDLFLRERLERLHVPHRLDVVLPEVGFVLRQSHRLQPRVGVPLSNRKTAKINTTCCGSAVKNKPVKLNTMCCGSAVKNKPV